MQWLTVVGVLLYLTRCNDAGALKCQPGSQDPLCALEKKEISPIQKDIVTASDESQCLPGSEWESSCHQCYCSELGFATCKKLESCLPEELVYPTPCKPNTTFKRDGNICICLENGSGLCTLRQPPTIVNKSPEEECTPGTMFKKSCNTCYCLPDGRVACTKRGCLDDIRVKKREIPEATQTTPKASPSNSSRVVCVANRMFIKDCNTCWCNEDGTSYFCTRRVCVEMPDDAENPDQELKLRVVKKECKPNEVFEMDGNMCRCNDDGKSFSCTRRACVDNDDKTATSRSVRALPEAPKACQPGQEFRMDCNKCLCNDEGQDFSCTRMDCAALNNNGGVDSFASARTKRDTTARTAMECVPGTVFDRECNVCRCTSDGHHAACTLKRCHQDSNSTITTTEPSPAFRCTPGDQFRRDCNDCSCSADGKTVYCTLRLCDEVVAEIKP